MGSDLETGEDLEDDDDDEFFFGEKKEEKEEKKVPNIEGEIEVNTEDIENAFKMSDEFVKHIKKPGKKEEESEEVVAPKMDRWEEMMKKPLPPHLAPNRLRGLIKVIQTFRNSNRFTRKKINKKDLEEFIAKSKEYHMYRYHMDNKYLLFQEEIERSVLRAQVAAKIVLPLDQYQQMYDFKKKPVFMLNNAKNMAHTLFMEQIFRLFPKELYTRLFADISFIKLFGLDTKKKRIYNDSIYERDQFPLELDEEEIEDPLFGDPRIRLDEIDAVVDNYDRLYRSIERKDIIGHEMEDLYQLHVNQFDEEDEKYDGEAEEITEKKWKDMLKREKIALREAELSEEEKPDENYRAEIQKIANMRIDTDSDKDPFGVSPSSI